MQTITGLRQRGAKAFALGVLLIIASMLLASISLADSPSQAGVSWDYRLLGKLNSSQDASGFTIVMTGSGSFDVSQPSSIDGGGTYTILDTEGSVVGSGIWTATTFHSFAPAGPGRSPGQGGRLELEAWFDGTGTSDLNGSQHVVVQCSMWGPKVGPPGYPWPPDFVTVGPYNSPQTGGVMFNLNQ